MRSLGLRTPTVLPSPIFDVKILTLAMRRAGTHPDADTCEEADSPAHNAQAHAETNAKAHAETWRA